jgi:hypothetical protein
MPNTANADGPPSSAAPPPPAARRATHHRCRTVIGPVWVTYTPGCATCHRLDVKRCSTAFLE